MMTLQPKHYIISKKTITNKPSIPQSTTTTCTWETLYFFYKEPHSSIIFSEKCTCEILWSATKSTSILKVATKKKQAIHRYYIIMASFIIYKLYICDICIIATFLSLQTYSAKNEHFVDTYIIAVRRVE